MKVAVLLVFASLACCNAQPEKGVASWYGEQHRGRLMANGRPFDPDRLTAASWFYPLGSVIRVTLQMETNRSVVVRITDRGPAKRLVEQGRIIDLSRAAFNHLASPDLGLVPVRIERMKSGESRHENRAHQQGAPKVHTADPV